jgi:hypothetical protein
MCERTCPRCGSTEHLEQYGIIGLYIACECGTILANRRDSEAAPIDMTEEQAEEWARQGTFVLPGAEAKDPADDELFRRD